MKRRLKEETILFISVVKWVFLASVIGIIVGLSTTIFLKALNWSIATTNQQPFYFLLLPVALFLSAVLTKYLAPDAEGHGTEKVIEAVHKRSGKINAAVVPVKIVATIITLASGGSAGKEGPCAQIGAGLSSVFADLFKFNESERRKLVICGISGGLRRSLERLLPEPFLASRFFSPAVFCMMFFCLHLFRGSWLTKFLHFLGLLIFIIL